MDPIGGVASVLQLVQAVGLLANGAFIACQRLRNAPKEINELSIQLPWIRSHLQNCETTLTTVSPSLLTSDLELSLTLALTEASSCFLDLERILSRTDGVSNLDSRIKWAAHIRSRAGKLVSRLENCGNRIESTLQLLSVRTSSRISTAVCGIQNDNEEIKQNVAVLLSKLNALVVPDSSNITNHQSYQNSQSSTAYKLKLRPERRLRAEPWNLGRVWSAMGVQGRGVPTTQSHWQDHYMTFAVSAPLAQLIGNYAVGLSVNVRTYSANPWSFQLLRGSRLDVCRIVPTTHPFLDACRRGDIGDIRNKLLSGEGRLNDRDDRGWTPLANAISSGDTATVRELLDHGADVDGTVGQLQTTPLQWALWHKSLDVTRLLLQHQASQDRMNMRGWNTVFFLWARLRQGEPCMTEFLNLLAEDSYLDLDIADAQNWTVLDRVAAVGTAKEVRRLMELGASPYQEAAPLRWTAIHQAVFHGNQSTFVELLPEYGDAAKYMVDDRGWTLLHIATSAGHAEIMRHLLRAGADPDAKSQPYRSHMPESLFDKRCRPQEVAAAQSKEREEAFLDILHEHRLSTGYVMIPSDSDSENENEEEFCEAKEFAV